MSVMVESAPGPIDEMIILWGWKGMWHGWNPLNV